MAVAQASKIAKKPWGGKPINSLDVVMEALDYLDMPVPSREAVAILAASTEKARFKGAIEECLMMNGGKPPSVDSKRYLFGLVSCISEMMQSAVQQIGYGEVGFDVLIQIGKTNGMAFRSAINAAMTKTDPNHHMSFDFVETELAQACEGLGLPPIAKPNRPRPVASQQQAAPASPVDSSAPARQQASSPQASSSNSEDAGEVINNNNGDDDRRFLSTHVYGGKAALCFNASTSRDKTNYTIGVDAAVAVSERTYDWKTAIKIQLGHKELPLLYAVLVGWRNSVKFDAHGAENDKSFEIERQDGKFFVKVSAKGQPQRAVPMGAQDAYPVSLVVLSQIIKQAPKELQDHADIIIHMMKQTLQIKPVAA